jgi:hypothetical protein
MKRNKYTLHPFTPILHNIKNNNNITKMKDTVLQLMHI